jgi:hypothetical protein
MRNIVLLFVALLGIGLIYWFGFYNPLEEIAKEIIEKELEIDKELGK